jgi:hypothetical protein
MFAEPRQVVASGDVVVVLDAGTRDVRGFDARTGATRFVLAPRGEGPGEFKRPSLLVGTPDGFAVLDQATARLTAYDRRARMQWTMVLNDVFITDGICVRRGTANSPSSGTRVVTVLKRRDSSLVEYDTTGRRLAVRSFPWKVMQKGAVGFAYTTFNSAAADNGDCVSAPLFGAEWGVIAARGIPRVFAMREPGAQAVIKTSDRVLDRSWGTVTTLQNQQSETEQALRGAAVNGDTAILYAAHTKLAPLRILDYYRASTGEYLFSRKLPFILIGFTVGRDGTVYGTRISDREQLVIAMQPAEAPKPDQPKKP